MAIDSKNPKLRTKITDLDDNLVIEILTHLPYEYVMVSKIVCKLWNSLISTPYFVCRFLRCHLQITNSSDMEEKQPRTFMCTKYQCSPKLISTHHLQIAGFSLSFVPCYQPQNLGDSDPIWVIRTFNDLVLCCEEESEPSLYYICNPITISSSYFVALPPAPTISDKRFRLCVDFICKRYHQKHQNPHQHDDVDVVLNSQDRFWVMRVHRFIDAANSNPKLEIFSSETGRPDEHPVPIPEGFFGESGEQVYFVESLVFHYNIFITVIDFPGFSAPTRTIKMPYPNPNNNRNVDWELF